MSMRMIVYVSPPPGLENLPPPLTQIGGSLPPRPRTWKALFKFFCKDATVPLVTKSFRMIGL
jgi:hypothetical protein